MPQTNKEMDSPRTLFLGNSFLYFSSCIDWLPKYFALLDLQLSITTEEYVRQLKMVTANDIPPAAMAKTRLMEIAVVRFSLKISKKSGVIT